MNVNEMYNIVLFATGKNREQGYISSDDFNTIIPMGMRSYIAYLLGNFQTYQPGKATSKVNFGQNSTIRARLSPAIKKSTLTINGSGVSVYPADYLQYDAILTSTNDKVKYVQQDGLAWALKSTLRPIATNPIFLIESTGFQFYPISLGTAKLSYISNPPSIKWGFTLDGNGRQIYDVATSVQPLFDDLAILEIIVRSLAIIGVNLTLPMVSQYAQEIKNVGQ